MEREITNEIVIHELKCWDRVFQDKWRGLKPWEFRKNDRDYKVGDIIIEREYRKMPLEYSEYKPYTGREVHEVIKYIIQGGQFGIPEGYCIMTTIEFSRKDK